MASITLDNNSNYYVSNLVPTGGETANAIHALGGNDTIFGDSYVDYIFGGDGSDLLYGLGNNDVLDGDAGNDTLYGGAGDDFCIGNNGNDVFYGNAGNDTLYGGVDSDRYYYTKSEGGIDIINDDKSETAATGYGGGTADYVYFTDVTAADLRFYGSGNNLIITDVNDVADGFLDTGVVVEDFFLGGNNLIERIYGSDFSYYDSSAWV